MMLAVMGFVVGGGGKREPGLPVTKLVEYSPTVLAEIFLQETKQKMMLIWHIFFKIKSPKSAEKHEVRGR